MTNILLVSHGNLAKGLLESAKMLVGEIEKIGYITFSENMGVDQLKEELEVYLANVESPLVIFTDFKGGTPFNVTRLLTKESEDMFVFYGMNLPMVVDACLLRENMNVKDLVENIEKNVDEGIGLA